MLETTTLSSKSLGSAAMIIGATIYSPDGERLGAVEDIVIDKASGRVSFVVASFGRFGASDGRFRANDGRFHPLPWVALNYDPKLDGYVFNLGKKSLKDAPCFDRGSQFELTLTEKRTIDAFYNTQGILQWVEVSCSG